LQVPLVLHSGIVFQGDEATFICPLPKLRILCLHTSPGHSQASVVPRSARTMLLSDLARSDKQFETYRDENATIREPNGRILGKHFNNTQETK
jgi:hypothetical protein